MSDVRASRHQQHRPAPVEPVGEGAGREGEEEPREPADEGDAGERGRVAGDAEGHQRQGDLEHAVGQVRRARRGDEVAVGAGERSSNGAGHRARLPGPPPPRARLGCWR